MKKETVAALTRINERFYSSRAADFSATRDGPWPGWQLLLRQLRQLTENADAPHQVRILDVGCGNGRLQRFLTSNLASPISYTGIDSSAQLLEEADRRAPSEARWLRVDLTQSTSLDELADERFDLIAVLAVMHHIPSFALRRCLLDLLAPLLSPNGLLALSHWQFGSSERFLGRTIAWEDHNKQSQERIDTTDLETGDHLLAWGPGVEAAADQPRRYCHHVGPDEAGRLVTGLGLELNETFRADGRDGDLNLYQLFRTPGATG